MDYGYMPLKYSLIQGKSGQNGITDTRLFALPEEISDPQRLLNTMKILRSHSVEELLITLHVLLKFNQIQFKI